MNNEFVKKIRTYMEENGLLQKGSRVLCALSGGADSVCLLYVLHLLKDEYELTLFSHHVHHGLRETADRDAAFSKAFSESLGVPCTCSFVDVSGEVLNTGESVEEAARRLRYNALFAEKTRVNADVLAVAHHKNDQAETILFQMIRGSGLKGLSGMQGKRQDIIRPLLSVTKEEILSFLREENLFFVEDETNFTEEATRNRIRHTVLPALTDIRADAVSKISDTGAYLQEADLYFREKAEAFITASAVCDADGLFVPEAPFLKLHTLEQEYVIRLLFEKLSISMKDKGRVHLKNAAALFSKETGKQVSFSGGITFRKTYGGVRVTKEEMQEEAAVPAYSMKISVFPYEKGTEIPQKLYTKWFDYDKIKGTLALRTREKGDLFSTRAGTGKKLKDYFIDEKIPREQRDRLPLVADGKNCLWVIGYRINANYKVTENTQKILQIEVVKEENHEG